MVVSWWVVTFLQVVSTTNVDMQGSEVHILHYLQDCFIRSTPHLSAFYAVLRLIS